MINPISRKSTREWAVIIGIYGMLTVLVWGLFAPDRGMWQDELLVLYLVQVHSDSPVAQLISPGVTPTRLLENVPYTLSHWSGSLILSLQLLYGINWFITGILAYLLLRRLFPQQSLLAYLGGGLTLTATSDFLTNSIVPMHIAFSATFYFLSLLCLIRWWQGNRWPWLILSGIALSCSVWTYDAAFASVLLTPLLLLALDNFRISKRLLKLTAFWYAVLAPYLIVFILFLMSPQSYAAVSLRPLPLKGKVFNALVMFMHNFTPWNWAIGRRQWFPAPPSILSFSFKFLIALFGAIVFGVVAAWLWRRQSETKERSRKDGRRMAVVFIICLLMALCSNAIYSSVQFSEVFYRTHWVSRVWASMAVALLTYWLGRSVLKSRQYTSLVLPTLFIALGIYGGLERQDYFLGYWRQHQSELRSIVEQIPGLKPDARLILFVPPQSSYLATTANYLAKSWMSYLYEDPSLFSRVFVWSEGRKTDCTIRDDIFICKGEENEDVLLPIAKSILLKYSPKENRYLLQPKLPRALIQGVVGETLGYNPLSQIVNRPLSGHIKAILYRPEYLGALFHGKASPDIEEKAVLARYDSSLVMKDLQAGHIDIFEPSETSSVISLRGAVHATGWAYDPVAKKPAKWVVVLDNGKPFAAVPINIQRRDVATTLANRNLLLSGWNIAVPAEDLGAGRHRLEFYALQSNGAFVPLTIRTGVVYIDVEVNDSM
ncbi:MAG: hypothetical protein ACHQ0Y_03200 [Thermodesulfovibrionales bacterium]